MAPSRFHYWNDDKLNELKRTFNQKTPVQLCKIHNKPWHNILAAYEFKKNHDKMMLKQEYQNGIKITTYEAAWYYTKETELAILAQFIED